MSLHYHKLHIGEIADAGSVTGALGQIGAQDADLAAINWQEVRAHAMRQALAAAAQEMGCTCAKSYDNASTYGSKSGDPDQGEVLGVLNNGTFLQLGVGIREDGTFFQFWNTGTQQCHPAELAQWKDCLRRHFHEQQMRAAMQILCVDDIVETRGADGALVIVGRKVDV